MFIVFTTISHRLRYMVKITVLYSMFHFVYCWRNVGFDAIVSLLLVNKGKKYIYLYRTEPKTHEIKPNWDAAELLHL